MSLQCCACRDVKSLKDFSNSQLRNKEAPRCVQCVQANCPATLATPQDDSSGRRCGACKLRLGLDRFKGQETKCKSCQSKRKWEEEEIVNATQRNPSAGACRVKDVQKEFGHLCEIPMAAYLEAGVASHRKDYVTKRDVQKASNAWDARGAAHEIDTQWGSMPWGGAYSDSNHYYGPGEYDYY
jgi:hypothetical protein